MTEEVKNIIEHEFKCLDHGFVRLIDVMGDDSSIVQAARVSYGKGTKSVNEDRGLIRYLMRHRHTTPFEMVEFKFHVKLPIFVARQWIRHRTANVNEYSGRYSEMKDEFYQPEETQIKIQSQNNKQGRADTGFDSVTTDIINDILDNNQQNSFHDYQKLLELGLAREISRIVLPVSNYTEWYWKIDLHNLFHFLSLRLDSHAQYEIRVYAEVIADIVKKAVPFAYEAFVDYQLNSVYFSKSELNIIKKFIPEILPQVDDLVNSGLSKREAVEFLEKIKKMKG